MKKVIILLLIVGAAYWGYKNFDSLLSGPGAFDESGNAIVLVFTMSGCGQPCSDVVSALQNKGVAFEEIDIGTDEGRSRYDKFGESLLPLTVVGNARVTGSDISAIQSALGEAQGMSAYSPLVQGVMQNHFDSEGKPRVVMYGTTTCPHCKRLLAYLDGRKVAYEFLDISRNSSAKYDYDILSGRGVPLTFVGFRRIDGFDANKMDQAIKDLL